MDPYFVVLPDDAAGTALAAVLRERDAGLRCVEHPSRRPWIVGRWEPGEVRTVTAGRTSLVTVGRCGAGPAELRRVAGEVRRVEELPAATRSWAGSYHLLAAVDGRTWLRGSAYGLRRLFHVDVDGVPVAGDRAGVLARLAGAEVDVAVLATHLMQPPPHPLTEATLWSGLRMVPNGSWLETTGPTWAYRRWHRPPEPVVPLAEGAVAVRAALREAVALRVAGTDLVGADLSGGMDSTSLAFLAAEAAPGRVMVSTGVDRVAGNDDLRWARRAAAHLPDAPHDVFSGDDMPLFYADVLDRDDFDQPADVVVNRARATAGLRRMAERGARLHLGGYGGDHLFLGQPAHYHDLIRRRPLQAYHQLRGYRALFGWRWAELAAAVADRRGYAAAFAGMDLGNSTAWKITSVRMSWLYQPRLPAWLTPYGAGLIADRMAAAAPARPLAPTRGRHVELFSLDDGTRVLRTLADLARRAGAPLEAPYFDDAVVDAALAVRLADRTTPYAYKRLLAEAMRPVLPAEMLTRRTKGHATSFASIGLRTHREDIVRLFEDSALARVGLVDADRIRAVCATPDAGELADAGLDSTLAAEVWLRNATGDRSIEEVRR